MRSRAEEWAGGRLHEARLRALKGRPGGWQHVGVYYELVRFLAARHVGTRWYLVGWRVNKRASAKEVARWIGHSDAKLVSLAIKEMVRAGLLERVAAPDSAAAHKAGTAPVVPSPPAMMAPAGTIPLATETIGRGGPADA